MICPSCGKEIPGASKFCLYCGSRVPTAPEPVVEMTPQFALDVADFKACGPTIVESGYLNERLRRGFEFTILLRDANSSAIVSDGELIVALKGPYPNASSSPHLFEPSQKAARSIGTRTDILWHRSFVLKTTDFRLQGIKNSGSTSDALPFFAYSYHETAPILSIDADYCVELHAWFVMPTNECLYQASVAVWSR
jgi:zinc-ribbon domain